jgi:glutathione S-transferase
VLTDVEKQAPQFYAWARVVADHPSVNGIYDEQRVVEHTHKRVAKLRSANA